MDLTPRPRRADGATIVSAYVPADTKRRLERAAAKTGLTLSEITKRCLEASLVEAERQLGLE